MNLNRFVQEVRRALRQPLPGAEAHDLLRATPIGQVLPRFTHKLPPKPGSVLMLFYEKDGRVQFPLIKRPTYPGAHSGQVSLPGGKAEAGETAIETALREGEEEIGLPPHSVQVLGTLSEFFVIPSNFMVTPVVAVTDAAPPLKPDHREVVRILQGDLDDLLAPDAVQVAEISAQQFRMRAPHFSIEGEIVWGATAMMLNELRMMVTTAS